MEDDDEIDDGYRFDPSKPLFQDPPDRIDEDWAGFVVGGMAVTNELRLAQSYKRAGDGLVEKALDDADLSCEWAYPILYVYRHVIELYLKLIVRPKKLTHELGPLADQFVSRIQNELGQTIPASVKARILEFDDIDPTAEGFRFAKDRKGLPNPRSGEWWVPIPHLRETMDWLVTGFERAHWALGAPRS
jgi:hypothetical protein